MAATAHPSAGTSYRAGYIDVNISGGILPRPPGNDAPSERRAIGAEGGYRLDHGIQGFVAAGYEPVRRAFERNFRERRELGAAFAVVRDGRPVVDLWGGAADRAAGRCWQQDTLQLVFSGTKGFVSVCLLILLERGLLDLDAPVARYWPEFGKPAIRIRDIVAHTARLPGLEVPVGIDDILDARRMARLLAEQSPNQDRRAAHCYHALTFGWLCGEVIRRVSGLSAGAFFAREVAGPLGLELWIGLPAEFESRVSRLELHAGWGAASFLDPALWARDPLVQSIWGNPATFTVETMPWNRPSHHAAEVPGANAIGTARSIARLYGCLASGGAPLVSPQTVVLGRTALADGYDEVHEARRRTGIGFQLQTDVMQFGPPADAFGHTGAGGSSHGAWPAQRVGYSYAMNLMHDDRSGDDRAQRLLAALWDCCAA